MHLNWEKTSPNKGGALTQVARFAGFAIIIGGWQLMATYYITGVIIAYCGFVLCLVECITESKLRGSPFLRSGAIAIVLIFASIFSFKVVFISAPLNFDSYAMRNGDYPSGTVIAGIPWNSHFTDLRVWVTNPTENDYDEVYLSVQPDRWNYKAAIVTENTGCQLNSLGGVSVLQASNIIGGATKVTGHREGDVFEAEDNSGDVFEHLITRGGYRLFCPKFPAHYAVQIVFALAAIDQKLESTISPAGRIANPKPGDWGISVAELKPIDKFDVLAARPSPSAVAITGRYKLGSKTYSISRTIKVADGN